MMTDTSVCEIASDVLLGPGERDLVDPVVNFRELLLTKWWCVHSNRNIMIMIPINETSIMRKVSPWACGSPSRPLTNPAQPPGIPSLFALLRLSTRPPLPRWPGLPCRLPSLIASGS